MRFNDIQICFAFKKICNSAILEKPAMASPFEVATKYRRIIETDQDSIFLKINSLLQHILPLS